MMMGWLNLNPGVPVITLLACCVRMCSLHGHCCRYLELSGNPRLTDVSAIQGITRLQYVIDASAYNDALLTELELLDVSTRSHRVLRMKVAVSSCVVMTQGRFHWHGHGAIQEVVVGIHGPEESPLLD